MRRPNRVQEAKAKVEEARLAWAAAKADPEATHETRMAAKDAYNYAVRNFVLAQGRRQPYG